MQLTIICKLCICKFLLGAKFVTQLSNPHGTLVVMPRVGKFLIDLMVYFQWSSQCPVWPFLPEWKDSDGAEPCSVRNSRGYRGSNAAFVQRPQAGHLTLLSFIFTLEKIRKAELFLRFKTVISEIYVTHIHTWTHTCSSEQGLSVHSFTVGCDFLERSDWEIMKTGCTYFRADIFYLY